MRFDSFSVTVDCEPDLDEDDDREPCDFTGLVDVNVNVNDDGEWDCPRCDRKHTITNIDLVEMTGPDPDDAYERMRDARLGL